MDSQTIQNLIADEGENAVADQLLDAVVYKSLDDTGRRLFFDTLLGIGRAADGLALFEQDPELARDPDLIPLFGEACCHTGNPESFVEHGVFDLLLQDPPRYLGGVGGSAVSCTFQLLERNTERKRIEQFAEELYNRVLFTSGGAMDPCVVYTLAKVHGNQACGTLMANRLRMLQMRPPFYAASVLARREQGGTLAKALGGLRNAPREAVFPEAPFVVRAGMGSFRERSQALDLAGAEQAGLSLPDLSIQRMRTGIEALRDLARDIYFNQMGAPYHKAAEQNGFALQPPILAMSTGRAGTQSMWMLLNQSPAYEAYHTLSLNLDSGDLNRLFYAILNGEVSDARCRAHVQKFIEYRIQEIAWTSAQGRTPVLVNHLDLVFAPIYLGIFEGSRFLHMRRDVARGLISMAYKRQFRYAQLRPLYAREDAESGLFEYARPSDISLEGNVVWYMRATALFANTMLDVVGSEQGAVLEMDELFALDTGALKRFLSLFPAGGFSLSDLEAHFAQKINSKDQLSVPTALRDVARARQIVADEGGHDLL